MSRRRASDRLASGLLELDEARSDYHMARRSGPQKRRPRGVPSQGAGADYHYRSESDWLWMSELAWDIYRNNMAAGSITDRAIDQTLQGGFVYDPNTGDQKLDDDLVEWWAEVACSPSECDPANEDTFYDQEEIVLRSTMVGGDIFGLPLQDGQVALTEGHLCRSPSRSVKEKIFHGVEMEPATRKRLNYWLLKEPVDPFRQVLKSNLTPVPAYDEDGERNVFHVRFPKRAHQTRGITAYAPIFDVAGYHDDVQFLKLVAARAQSLFVFVEQRASTFDPAYLAAEMSLGKDVTRDKAEEYENNARQYKEVGPGSVIRSLPGAKVEPWSSNIPNPEFFPHARMLLTFIGINLGMPLVMAMMDASETNFSGYRGAIDQARMGFRKNQKRLITRWHRPYMRFKLHKYGEQESAIRKLIERAKTTRSKVNIFKHDWHPPSWPYIEPTKDATADLIRDANMLTSPRRRCRERGDEWNDIAREFVEDRGKAMRMALKEATEIKKEFNLETPVEVIARQLAPMPMSERVNVTISEAGTDQQVEQQPSPKPSEKKNAGK